MGTRTKTLLTRTRLIAQGILLMAGCALIAGTSVGAQATEPRGLAFRSSSQATGRFVIADFDGDHKPDFATVNADQTFIHLTNYSIHFELSKGLDAEIGLTAPSGGLQLTTRDVNGDDSLDLVVRTVFNSNLVAVFLNDGHGSFTLARRELFPSVENEPRSRLSPEALHRAERALSLPSRNGFGDRVETEPSDRVKTIAEPCQIEKQTWFRGFLGHSLSGRAPPEQS